MGWIDPTDRVNGDVLDANLWNQDVVENTLAIFRHLTPVGTVIPYAGDWGTDYVNLADPDVGAPFHLPCTGGIYETADFPLLSRVLGHTFAPLGSGHEEGDIAGGEHLVGGGTDADGNPYIEEAVYRYQTSPLGWKLVVADGFVVPDMRGRSPVGTTTINTLQDVDGLYPFGLGERWGSSRTGYHRHDVRLTHYSAVRVLFQGNGSGAAGSAYTPTYGPVENGAGDYLTAFPLHMTEEQTAAAWGNCMNYQPSTGVNFLIFTGQVVADHAPMSTGLRDGSVHRLHPVTTAHIIHQRLADPDISDDERERLEAQLNGEPWPPMPEEVS